MPDRIPSRRRAVAPWVVAVLAMSACSEIAPARTDRRERTSTTVTAPRGSDLEISALDSELESAGAEPRQRLRLHPPADCEVPVTAVLRTRTVFQAEGQVMPIGGTTERDLTYRCTAVDDREVSIEVALEAVRSDGLPVPPGAALLGSAIPATYDLQGQLIDLPAVPADLAEASPELLERVARSGIVPVITLPDDPVGEGARWVQRSTVTVLDLPIDRTDTITIEAIDGDVVTATVDVAYELEDGDVGGRLSVTWDLTEVLPETTGTIEGELRTTGAALGDPGTAVIGIELAQELHRR